MHLYATFDPNSPLWIQNPNKTRRGSPVVTNQYDAISSQGKTNPLDINHFMLHLLLIQSWVNKTKLYHKTEHSVLKWYLF